MTFVKYVSSDSEFFSKCKSVFTEWRQKDLLLSSLNMNMIHMNETGVFLHIFYDSMIPRVKYGLLSAFGVIACRYIAVSHLLSALFHANWMRCLATSVKNICEKLTFQCVRTFVYVNLFFTVKCQKRALIMWRQSFCILHIQKPVSHFSTASIHSIYLLLISGQGHRCAGPFVRCLPQVKKIPKQITHLFIHEVVPLLVIK